MWFLLGLVTGWVSMIAALLFLSAAMRDTERESVRKIRMQEQVIVKAENRNDS